MQSHASVIKYIEMTKAIRFIYTYSIIDTNAYLYTLAKKIYISQLKKKITEHWSALNDHYMSISYLRSPLLKSEVVTGQLVCWKAYKNGFHIIAWHFLNVMTRRRVLLLDIIYLFSSPTSYPWALLSHWARITGPPLEWVAVNFSAFHLRVISRFLRPTAAFVSAPFFILFYWELSLFFLICFVFRFCSYWCLFYEQH